MLEVRMSWIHLAVPIFQAHDMRILAVYPCVTTARAMAAQTNAKAVVDGVAYLAAPHILLWVASMLFGDLIANRGADLLDPRSREGGGNMEGGVDVTLKASKGIGCSKAS